jgi:sulfur-carrier protein adenylyltransferase/sulfurtransferase
VTDLRDTPPELSRDEVRRYGRHLTLPEVGLAGQRRLKGARVLVVGAGGLGCPAALYLAAAGVGTLGLVDDDVVDESNLQRQVAHGTSFVGRPKLESLRARLTDLNPNVALETHPVRLTRDNAMAILARYDVVLDGTDNFATRYLVNDACVLLGKPNVYGSILRFEGQASVFDAPRGPCYRCVFPEPPPPGVVPSCAEAGVLGVLPGVIGAVQATETIKLVLGAKDTLVGRLLLYDAWAMRFRELVLKRDPACPLCGEHPSIRELVDYDDFCGTKAEETMSATGDQVAAREFKAMRERGDDVVLLDVREPAELALSRLGSETHIPLAMLPLRASELDPARRIVVMCHHGSRSMFALRWLREHGFPDTFNLTGGIDAYACDADPSIPRY